MVSTTLQQCLSTVQYSIEILAENDEKSGTGNDEHSLDLSLCHINQNGEIRYVVIWFACCAQKDTGEPAKNLSTHFIMRNWRDKSQNDFLGNK